jgi:hypothetical protein
MIQDGRRFDCTSRPVRIWRNLARWPYTEIYSIYTPSYQGALRALLALVRDQITAQDSAGVELPAHTHARWIDRGTRRPLGQSAHQRLRIEHKNGLSVHSGRDFASSDPRPPRLRPLSADRREPWRRVARLRLRPNRENWRATELSRSAFRTHARQVPRSGSRHDLPVQRDHVMEVCSASASAP